MTARHVVLTGGASDLGEACARRFARTGATLSLLDGDAPRCRSRRRSTPRRRRLRLAITGVMLPVDAAYLAVAACTAFAGGMPKEG